MWISWPVLSLGSAPIATAYLLSCRINRGVSRIAAVTINHDMHRTPYSQPCVMRGSTSGLGLAAGLITSLGQNAVCLHSYSFSVSTNNYATAFFRWCICSEPHQYLSSGRTDVFLHAAARRLLSSITIAGGPDVPIWFVPLLATRGSIR